MTCVLSFSDRMHDCDTQLIFSGATPASERESVCFQGALVRVCQQAGIIAAVRATVVTKLKFNTNLQSHAMSNAVGLR